MPDEEARLTCAERRRQEDERARARPNGWNHVQVQEMESFRGRVHGVDLAALVEGVRLMLVQDDEAIAVVGESRHSTRPANADVFHGSPMENPDLGRSLLELGAERDGLVRLDLENG